MSFMPHRISLSGGGGSGISGSGNGAANRIAVWSNATTIGSYANFEFDGTTFSTLLDVLLNKAGTAAADSTIRQSSTSGSLALWGGPANTSASLTAYAVSHATKPAYLEYSVGATVYAQFNSGTITLGNASSVAAVLLRGSVTVQATGVGQFSIKDTVSHAAGGVPVINWKDASNTIGQIGFATANTFTFFHNVLSASGNYAWQVNSSSVMLLDQNGKITIGGAAGAQFHVVNGRGFSITAPGNVINYVFINSTSNTAGAGAAFDATVAGGSANDAFSAYNVSGVTSWAVGLDNSASDRFSISNGATLGTNEYFSISTAGIVTIGTGTATTHVLNTSLATNASDLLTMTNGPTGKAGDPAIYINITVNGSARVIPAW